MGIRCVCVWGLGERDLGNVYASSVLPCPLSLEILHVGFAETAAPNTNTQMDKYLQKSISRWDFLECCSLNFTLPYSK